MITPRRIQLSRKKGFRLPSAAVNVARPTRWGNPFKVGAPHPTRGYPMATVVTIELFRKWLFEGDRDSTGRHTLRMGVEYLRGHDLACWCKPGDLCHADVWLQLVNDPHAEPVERVKLGVEYVIMGRRCRVDRLPDSLGWGSFEFAHTDDIGGGVYHSGFGKVYSLAMLDLLDGKGAA